MKTLKCAVAVVVAGHGDQGAVAGRVADQAVYFVVLAGASHLVRNGSLRQALRRVFVEIARGTVAGLGVVLGGPHLFCKQAIPVVGAADYTVIFLDLYISKKIVFGLQHFFSDLPSTSNK